MTVSELGVGYDNNVISACCGMIYGCVLISYMEREGIVVQNRSLYY